MQGAAENMAHLAFIGNCPEQLGVDVIPYLLAGPLLELLGCAQIAGKSTECQWPKHLQMNSSIQGDDYLRHDDACTMTASHCKYIMELEAC